MDRSWLRASVRGDCSNQSSGERDKGENNECGIGPFIAQQKATGSDRHTQCGEERKGGETERRGEEEKDVRQNQGWPGRGFANMPPCTAGDFGKSGLTLRMPMNQGDACFYDNINLFSRVCQQGLIINAFARTHPSIFCLKILRWPPTLLLTAD